MGGTVCSLSCLRPTRQSAEAGGQRHQSARTRTRWREDDGPFLSVHPEGERHCEGDSAHNRPPILRCRSVAGRFARSFPTAALHGVSGELPEKDAPARGYAQQTVRALCFLVFPAFLFFVGFAFARLCRKAKVQPLGPILVSRSTTRLCRSTSTLRSTSRILLITIACTKTKTHLDDQVRILVPDPEHERTAV